MLEKKCGRNSLAYLAAALVTKKKKFCDIGTWKRKTSAFYLLASDQQKKERES
jgi:hypothetical protein